MRARFCVIQIQFCCRGKVVRFQPALSVSESAAAPKSLAKAETMPLGAWNLQEQGHIINLMDALRANVAKTQ